LSIGTCGQEKAGHYEIMIRGVDVGDYVMRIQVDGKDIFDSPFLHYVEGQIMTQSNIEDINNKRCCGCEPTQIYNFAPGEDFAGSTSSLSW
jgi:hypothetical protein